MCTALTFVCHVCFFARVESDVLGQHRSVVLLAMADEGVEKRFGHNFAADRSAQVNGERSGAAGHRRGSDSR